MNPSASGGIGMARNSHPKSGAAKFSECGPDRNWQWHLDKVFVKINGETHYMWRALDHEGEELDAFVSKRRDRNAALRFLRLSAQAETSSNLPDTTSWPDSRNSGWWRRQEIRRWRRICRVIGGSFLLP